MPKSDEEIAATMYGTPEAARAVNPPPNPIVISDEDDDVDAEDCGPIERMYRNSGMNP